MPVFISDGILARVRDGRFVADRQSQASNNGGERRELSTPLAITKRCVAYTPEVFRDRRPLLLSLAEELNAKDTRVLAIRGESGVGKTALLRALVEMMGSADEQVLWIDATYVHTETDMATVIIDALRHLSKSSSANLTGVSADITDDPMAALQAQLKQLGDLPVLVVIDHVEALTNNSPNPQFVSPITDELLAFLNALPNISIALAGQQLPATVKRLQGVKHHRLGVLSSSQHSPLTPKLKRFSQASLSALEQSVAAGLVALRHPVSLPQWRELTAGLNRSGQHLEFNQSLASDREFFAQLKQSAFKGCLKRSMPPQVLLQHWHQGNASNNHSDAAITWMYHWYQAAAPILEEKLPAAQVAQAHRWLSQWYLSQRNVPMQLRWLVVPNSQLVQEARYHLQAAEKLEAQATAKKPKPLALPEEDSTSDLGLDFKNADADSLEELSIQADASNSHHRDKPSLSGRQQSMSEPPNPAPHSSEPPVIIVKEVAVLENHDEQTAPYSAPLQQEQGNVSVSGKSDILPMVSTDNRDLAALQKSNSTYAAQLVQAKQLISAGQPQQGIVQLKQLAEGLHHAAEKTDWLLMVTHSHLARLLLAEWAINEVTHYYKLANEAMSRLEEVSEHQEKLSYWRVVLAIIGSELHMVKGQQEKAMAKLTAIKEEPALNANKPLKGQWLFVQAKVQDEAGQAELAASTYEQSIRVNRQVAAKLMEQEVEDSAQQSSEPFELQLSAAQCWMMVIAAQSNLGCIALESANYAKAKTLFEELASLEVAHQSGGTSVETYRLLAEANRGLNKPTLAMHNLHQAIKVATATNRVDYHVAVLWDLAELDSEKTTEHLNAALVLLKQDGLADERWALAWQQKIVERLSAVES